MLFRSGAGMRDDDYEGYDGHEGYLNEEEPKESEEHRDVISGKAQGGAAWDVYHHQSSVTSMGLCDGNQIFIPSKSSPPTAAPIPIASVRNPTPSLPTVVVGDQTTTSALTCSGQVKSKGSSRIGNRQRSMDEEDTYDFFGGPDLGEGYYMRSREYDRTEFVPSPSSSVAAAVLAGGFSTSGSERQRERERERRTVVPGGEERQSRSRSRSQSRTPSPAFISSPVSTTPNDQVQSGRKRSSSTSATPSGSACFITASSLTSDLLSPPSQRGRTSTQPQPQSQLLSQSQSRGRSSTRTASSPSSCSSVASSPMGSLSPDGLVRSGGREREREKERGRERRGRERTSGKMLSASEVESAVSSEVRAGSGSSSTSTARNGGGNGLEATDSSTTSSCSSSTSTVMGPPPSNAIGVNISPINKDQEHRSNFLPQQEVKYMRHTEEQRRVHPTRSNSPALDMRMSMPPVARSGVCDEHAATNQRDKGSGTTPTKITSPSIAPPVPPPPPPSPSPILPHAGSIGHTRSSSHSESVPPSTTLSPSKLRLPPLIPPPPLPAKPSTSFTAVSSSPGSPISAFTTPKGLASPTSAGSGEHSIVGKAVDIVSSAGAFLGLWQHNTVPEGS